MPTPYPSAEHKVKPPFSGSQQRGSKFQTIVSEAARLFNLQGTTATTLSDIARRIGLTNTSLYHYARNKEELVYQCYLASCDAGDEIMSEAEQDAATGLDCLCNFVKLFFARRNEIDQGRRPHTAMLTEIPALGTKHRKEIEQRVEKHFHTLLEFMQRGINDGSVSECATIPTTQAFKAIINWSYVWYGNLPDSSRAAAIEQLLKLIKFGISPHPYQFGDIHFPTLQSQISAGFDREKQNEIKRNAFFQVGSIMFNERGYMGASLDDVAEKLDVTKGAFYYHIRNKEDLLHQCFLRTLTLIDEMINRAQNDGKNGAEKIELVLRYLFNVQHSSDGPLIAYRCLPSLSNVRRKEILKRTRASSKRLGEFISEGIKDGSICSVNPGIIENAFAGTIDLAPRIATRMHFSDNSKVSAEYLGLFFNGIANHSKHDSKEHSDGQCYQHRSN